MARILRIISRVKNENGAELRKIPRKIRILLFVGTPNHQTSPNFTNRTQNTEHHSSFIVKILPLQYTSLCYLYRPCNKDPTRQPQNLRSTSSDTVRILLLFVFRSASPSFFGYIDSSSQSFCKNNGSLLWRSGRIGACR